MKERGAPGLSWPAGYLPGDGLPRHNAAHHTGRLGQDARDRGRGKAGGAVVFRVLTALFPILRTGGRWERREARRRTGATGILFSFRGPSTFERGRTTPAAWRVIQILVDGQVVRDWPFTPHAPPYWLRLTAGDHSVEIHGVPDEVLWRSNVSVDATPVVISIWPPTSGLTDRPSKVLINGSPVATTDAD